MFRRRFYAEGESGNSVDVPTIPDVPDAGEGFDQSAFESELASSLGAAEMLTGEDEASSQPTPVSPDAGGSSSAPEPSEDASSTPEQPEEAATEKPEEKPQESQTPLMDRVATEFGWNAKDKYQTDEEFLKGVANSQQMLGQRDEDAALGKELRPHLPQIQAALSGQAPQPEAPKAEAAPAPDGQPAWNPAWDRYLEKDEETGRQMVREDTPENVQREIADWEGKYIEWRQNDELRKRMEPILEQHEKQILERLESQRAKDNEESAYLNAIERIYESNKEKIYELTKDGEPQVNSEGQHVLKPWGVKYYQKVEEIRNSGMQASPDQMHEIASMFADLQFQNTNAPAQAATPKPSPTPSEPVQNSTVTPEPEVSDSLSFRDQLSRDFDRANL